MQPLLTHLRDATAASHALLDAAFGSLEMSDRADYVRFLSGHAIGLAPLFGNFRAFVEDDLGLACPDYLGMLHQDLAALGIDGAELPRIAAAGGLTHAATGYVIAGSRLGLTMIRRQGYWGAAHALPSAYMEDERGLAIWKDAVGWLKQRELDDAQAERNAAVAAFDTFRAAFDASATINAR
ncbi:heme oxygenase [Novosphingobium chloroacetimidivorans]|uniref:Heme oxygenase n=1 Tax=Novosphingobium chloroacetimidivorans TaxID=1428314 RepID=A0A7W7KCH0_9SPHN|nr:biliverdin-producing heme oxygenase [Novosphingobium chloroacetimidivorans]MBB4859980.1 heme oxygenase [Novosphingobium chloroacetimidivorans]